MPRQSNTGKLSAVAIRNAKGREKAYKLSDGAGLFLLVNPNGAKYWRLKYRLHGREKTLALGVFPHPTRAVHSILAKSAADYILEDRGPKAACPSFPTSE